MWLKLKIGKGQQKELTSAKETAEEDSVGLGVDDTEVLAMKETVQAAIDAMNAEVYNLQKCREAPLGKKISTLRADLGKNIRTRMNFPV